MSDFEQEVANRYNAGLMRFTITLPYVLGIDQFSYERLFDYDETTGDPLTNESLMAFYIDDFRFALAKAFKEVTDERA